jgi:hypothetical protein
MAKLQLIIDADDAGDLASTLSALADTLGGETDIVDAAGQELPGATAKPGRRGRPPKTAPVTAPAAAASPDTTASGGQDTATDAGSGAGPTATSTASPSDGAVTKEAVAAKMTEAMEKATPLAIQGALEEAGIPKRLSEIPADKYADAIAVFDKVIALS